MGELPTALANAEPRCPDAQAPVRLRAVETADLAMLRAHRNQVSTRRWLENQSETDENQQWVWFESGGARGFRIIEHNGKAMAIGRVGPCINDRAHNHEVLVGLDIFEAYRGRGLGKMFFHAVCQEAQTLGSRLALWVFADNHRALSIYRQAGFVEDPASERRRLPRIANGIKVDTLFDYLKMVRNR